MSPKTCFYLKFSSKSFKGLIFLGGRILFKAGKPATVSLALYYPATYALVTLIALP